MAITLYSKENCVQCKATVRKLEDLGVEYEYIDVVADAEALDKIKSLGYLQAPVVITDTEHWSGYRPDKLKSLA